MKHLAFLNVLHLTSAAILQLTEPPKNGTVFTIRVDYVNHVNSCSTYPTKSLNFSSAYYSSRPTDRGLVPHFSPWKNETSKPRNFSTPKETSNPFSGGNRFRFMWILQIAILVGMVLLM